MDADPKPICACYAIQDNNGVLRPVLCARHTEELYQALGPSRWRIPKYERWFDKQGDATDRQKIIYDRWPGEGYGTSVTITPVSHYFLVRGSWSDSCD